MLFSDPSVKSYHSMAMLRTCCTLWELICCFKISL